MYVSIHSLKAHSSSLIKLKNSQFDDTIEVVLLKTNSAQKKDPMQNTARGLFAYIIKKNYALLAAFSILAQLSLSVTMRLNTGAFSLLSLSTQK